MEECEILQLVYKPIQGQLRTTEIEIVEAKPRNSSLFSEAGNCVATESSVFAHVWPIPCFYNIQWVILDSTFVLFNHTKCNFDSLALELQRRRRRLFSRRFWGGSW